MSVPAKTEIKVSHTTNRFHGGIHPKEFKELSSGAAIQTFVDATGQLALPLKQHLGATPLAIVSAGDEIKAYAPLTQIDAPIGAILHAPCDARVEAVRPGYCGHASGQPEAQVLLQIEDVAAAEQALPPAPFNPDYLNIIQHAEVTELRNSIQAAGIVGMGGAAFPTHIKLGAQKIHTLIINAMECEPYITCDDVMLRNYASQVLVGALIAARITGAEKIIVATEDNKPEAIAEVKRSAEALDLPVPIEIVVAPTRYPSGGEKQTIELVTGQQVPKGGLPSAIGVVVQNVSTLFAVYEAVIEQRPLVRRLVTITGDQIAQPGNYWIYFGTRLSAVLNKLEKPDARPFSVIIGGPLMGNAISDHSYPIQKNTNCVIANHSNALERPWLNEAKPHQACIRCSECEKVCPIELLPQQLFWYSATQQWEPLQAQNLADCIECGACSYVCPSEIPLVHYFRYAKSEIREQAKKKQKSEHAKNRFEFREFRLQREKSERAMKHQQAAQARRKAANASDDNEVSTEDDKQAAIAAALARVKAKKQNEAGSDQPADTDQGES